MRRASAQFRNAIRFGTDCTLPQRDYHFPERLPAPNTADVRELRMRTGNGCPNRVANRPRGTDLLPWLSLVVVLIVAAPVGAAAPGAVVVADFDYSDTSGEALDQTAAHRARIAAFGDVLREGLGAQGGYRVVRLQCAQPLCTAGAMRSEEFVAAAHRAGARYAVYGGIRKMSTLVQWGEVQLLDLDSNALLLRRTVTFRGDTDTAFRRAAEFVGETVRDALPRP
jgi:hypothetical protein